MAKTTFEHGTIVTPDFLNKIFKNGHVHDGGADDGHCDKINITNNTTGNLPINRVEGNLPPTRIDGCAFGSFEIDINPFTNIRVDYESSAIPSGNNNPVIVRLHFPAKNGEMPVSGILGSSGTSKPAIPVLLRPTSDIMHPLVVLNDTNLIQPGAVKIAQNGEVTFYALQHNEGTSRPIYNNSFVVGSNVGWFPFTIQYPIIHQSS